MKILTTHFDIGSIKLIFFLRVLRISYVFCIFRPKDNKYTEIEFNLEGHSTKLYGTYT